MQIDHLVFAAPDLESGTAWMTRHLGVGPGGFGQHPLMGTHNALWSLGRCYLEVIAIDPNAAPQRSRWFGLDDPGVQASLADGPRLLTWVARVPGLANALANTSLPMGEAVRVTRTGLYWDLSVRPDGALVEGGRAPTLIEWPPEVMTPEKTLPNSGVRLRGVVIGGASDALRTFTSQMHGVSCTQYGEPLSAIVQRPDGHRIALS